MERVSQLLLTIILVLFTTYAVFLTVTIIVVHPQVITRYSATQSIHISCTVMRPYFTFFAATFVYYLDKWEGSYSTYVQDCLKKSSAVQHQASLCWIKHVYRESNKPCKSSLLSCLVRIQHLQTGCSQAMVWCHWFCTHLPFPPMLCKEEKAFIHISHFMLSSLKTIDVWTWLHDRLAVICLLLTYPKQRHDQAGSLASW